MLSDSLRGAFLSIVRLGIGRPNGLTFDSIDWQAIEDLANKHGLLSILVDGVECLPELLRPPKAILLEWIGNTLQNYEQRYKQYEKAVESMAYWYNKHGFKMMILKGYACSLDWPKPDHRPCGDIDIWQFGQQKDADSTLSVEMGIKINNSHHHHTVFNWHNFTVENHYDFDNIHAHESNKRIEKVFKELGQDGSNWIEVNGEKVYLPSPNLHALFLIRHMLSHFAAAEISLRQVLDWAFFVEKHTKEVDWKWLLGVLKEYHMKDFFNLINAICIEDLGFSADIFPSVQFLPCLKERVLNDIMEPEYGTAEPSGLVKRLVYKYRRWQGNAWKQELCYSESRWSSFWSGVWAKLLKPASI